MSLCDLLLPYIPYQHAIHAIACEIVGDNELVINWLNGIALTNDKQHSGSAIRPLEWNVLVTNMIKKGSKCTPLEKIVISPWRHVKVQKHERGAP